jgi:hypothetical protein
MSRSATRSRKSWWRSQRRPPHGDAKRIARRIRLSTCGSVKMYEEPCRFIAELRASWLSGTHRRSASAWLTGSWWVRARLRRMRTASSELRSYVLTTAMMSSPLPPSPPAHSRSGLRRCNRVSSVGLAASSKSSSRRCARECARRQPNRAYFRQRHPTSKRNPSVIYGITEGA